MRIGHGYDAHRFCDGKPLVLCGVNVAYERGLLAHSDGDVPVHALMDAMLGAAGLGDIGIFFPPTDARYKDIDSLILLRETAKMITSNKFVLVNADITIIAQEPKLSGYTGAMREAVAGALKCPCGRINIKATTEEHMGFTGALEGIAAHAVVLLEETSGKIKNL